MVIVKPPIALASKYSNLTQFILVQKLIPTKIHGVNNENIRLNSTTVNIVLRLDLNSIKCIHFTQI